MQAAAPQGAPVGLERPVPTDGVGAAGELAADGREGPPHQGGDLEHRAPLLAQVGQADALVFGQVAG
ncbi:hypothetical protein BH20CHL7_BH20CHL7_12940 [soil metagenome]